MNFTSIGKDISDAGNQRVNYAFVDFQLEMTCDLIMVLNYSNLKSTAKEHEKLHTFK